MNSRIFAWKRENAALLKMPLVLKNRPFAQEKYPFTRYNYTMTL
jgi:hypothetical protein